MKFLEFFLLSSGDYVDRYINISNTLSRLTREVRIKAGTLWKLNLYIQHEQGKHGDIATTWQDRFLSGPFQLIIPLFEDKYPVQLQML
jgi:hypothetical protein